MSVPIGEYRNQRGASLRVVGPIDFPRWQSLGGIYYARADDELFGLTEYLVTAESLRDCGYEYIEESA